MVIGDVVRVRSESSFHYRRMGRITRVGEYTVWVQFVDYLDPLVFAYVEVEPVTEDVSAPKYDI